MRRRVISYGYIVAEHFQRAAAYVDPILKGKKPADDGAQRGAGSSPNLSGHCRCPRPLPQIQVSWSGVRTHVLQGSVGRKRPSGRHIARWGMPLRGGPGHAVTFSKMVLAQGLGDADCQTARDEKSDCRAGATVKINYDRSKTRAPPSGGLMSLAGRWMR